MKITTVGLGSSQDYGRLKVYFEAQLEPDESIDESLDALRVLVAAELNLGDEFSTVRNEIRNKKRELADLVAAIGLAKIQLEVATNKWQNLLDYFAGSHPAIGSIITGAPIVAQINFDEIDDGYDQEVDSFSDIPCPDFPLLDEEGYDRNF